MTKSTTTKPVFGYRCPECGSGTIQAVTIPNYEVQAGERKFTVKEATIGRCTRCGVECFSAGEWKRWLREGR